MRSKTSLDFKLILTAGGIFRASVRTAAVRQRDDITTGTDGLPEYVAALVDRGVNERMARRLLFGLPAEADVEAQIEWIDGIIARDPQKFENPAGMYVSLIRDGVTPPPGFLSSRRRMELQRLAEDQRLADAADVSRRLDVECRYAQYRDEHVQSYIGSLTPEARLKLSKDARKVAIKHISHFDSLTREQQQDLINSFAFRIVVEEIPLPSLEEFETRGSFQQMSLTSSVGR